MTVRGTSTRGDVNGHRLGSADRPRRDFTCVLASFTGDKGSRLKPSGSFPLTPPLALFCRRSHHPRRLSSDCKLPLKRSLLSPKLGDRNLARSVRDGSPPWELHNPASTTSASGHVGICLGLCHRDRNVFRASSAALSSHLLVLRTFGCLDLCPVRFTPSTHPAWLTG